MRLHMSMLHTGHSHYEYFAVYVFTQPHKHKLDSIQDLFFRGIDIPKLKSIVCPTIYRQNANIFNQDLNLNAESIFITVTPYNSFDA